MRELSKMFILLLVSYYIDINLGGFPSNIEAAADLNTCPFDSGYICFIFLLFSLLIMAFPIAPKSPPLLFVCL
jgi:hypothetical protein